MRLYDITDEMLPITLIIGPTGTQLFSQSGERTRELSNYYYYVHTYI